MSFGNWLSSVQNTLLRQLHTCRTTIGIQAATTCSCHKNGQTISTCIDLRVFVVSIHSFRSHFLYVCRKQARWRLFETTGWNSRRACWQRINAGTSTAVSPAAISALSFWFNSRSSGRKCFLCFVLRCNENDEFFASFKTSSVHIWMEVNFLQSLEKKKSYLVRSKVRQHNPNCKLLLGC